MKSCLCGYVGFKFCPLTYYFELVHVCDHLCKNHPFTAKCNFSFSASYTSSSKVCPANIFIDYKLISSLTVRKLSLNTGLEMALEQNVHFQFN